MNPRKPLLVTAVLLTTVAVLTHSAGTTLATWADTEWAHAPVGTLDCDGTIATRGAGRVLSGSALTLDLDDAVALHGVEVTHDGTHLSLTPPTAAPADGVNAYADPLNVGVAQDLINLELTGVLKLPLNTTTGVVGQYGQATPEGKARGASGYITSSGAVAAHTGSGYPEFASLNLSGLLNQLGHDLATLTSGVGDINLRAGALAARAEADTCQELWQGGGPVREYLTSALELEAEVEAVGDLVQGVAGPGGVVDTLETLVNGLVSDQGVIDGVTSVVTGVVAGLLDGLGLGNAHTTVTATVDTTPITDFLTQPFGDEAGIVEINPYNGVITIDIAALMGEAYPHEYAHGLNELPPNTTILNQPHVLTTLTGALTSALGQWITDLDSLVDSVINAIDVELIVGIGLRSGLLGTVAEVEVTIAGELTDLDVGVETTTLVSGVPLLGGILDGIVNELVQGASRVALLDGVTGVLSQALQSVGDLVAGLDTLVDPIVASVSGMYTALFLDGVVGLRLNAQNVAAGGGVSSGSPPSGWAGLPSGQADVAALHLAVLDVVGALGVDLYFARASVGPACLVDAGVGSGCG